MISRMHFAPTFALLSSHASLWRLFVALALLILSGASIALAGPREQAARMHDRLAGVPADETTLTRWRAVLPGNPTAAANIAMNNPNFYAVTLKNFAAPWTNRDQNAFVPLNDYVTLVMGMVRDNVPFNQILSANMLYVAPSVTPARFGHEQRALRGARAAHARARLQPERARSRRRRRPSTVRRMRRRPARSRRAPPPKRSSSLAPTARCSASR